MPRYRHFSPGDPLPPLRQRTTLRERFSLGSMAGRYLLLAFYGASDGPLATEARAAATARPGVFDNRFASFFGIGTTPGHTSTAPANGQHFFCDDDQTLARALGAADADSTPEAPYRPLWILVDPMLRLIEVRPMTGGSAEAMMAFVESHPPPARFAGIALQAPILYLPRVFEPALCQTLIDRYERHGGETSGFMQEVDGKTVGLHDPAFKSRRDHIIDDQKLIRTLQERILRRVVPEIAKAHAFHATRMERYIVSCYRADEGGHFAPHRDNTTPGTAHRRFAVSINLNESFEGGEVSFPEYSPQGFKAPAGGAVVFSCSLLHAVSRVTQGVRYAFLPFVYDDAAAAIRAQNMASLSTGTENT